MQFLQCTVCAGETEHLDGRCARCMTLSEGATRPMNMTKCKQCARDIPSAALACVFCNALFHHEGVSKKTTDAAFEAGVNMGNARKVCTNYPQGKSMFNVSLSWDIVFQCVTRLHITHARKYVNPVVSVTGDLMDLLRLHVSKRDKEHIDLARAWLQNLWSAYTGTAKAAQVKLREDRKTNVLQKLGALSANLRIQEAALSKVTLDHYQLTAEAFKDILLTLGVLKELKRVRTPVRIITVRRPDPKANQEDPAEHEDERVYVPQPLPTEVTTTFP